MGPVSTGRFYLARPLISKRAGNRGQTFLSARPVDVSNEGRQECLPPYSIKTLRFSEITCCKSIIDPPREGYTGPTTSDSKQVAVTRCREEKETTISNSNNTFT